MEPNEFVTLHARRRVNLAVLARLNQMIAETRAEMAREKLGLRLLGPALVLIGVSYGIVLLLR